MSAALPTREPVPQWRLALDDVVGGFKARRIWMLLARMDIRQRYRRSILGPFWITLSMVAFILGIGPLYSHLLGRRSEEFIPYLAMGVITWSLILGMVVEGAGAFAAAENLVRSVKLPYTVHILRAQQRVLTIFAHNLVAFLPFAIYLGIHPQWTWLAAIPGVGLIVLAAVPTALMLGILSVRFRDLQQMITSIMQLAFFMTPIFWEVELLKERTYIADYNPFHILLETVRRPIVEGIPPPIIYLKAGILIAILYAVAVPFFIRYRRRLAFWV